MTDKEILQTNLGWRDEWKNNLEKVERVRDIKLVTVKVMLILFSTFSSSIKDLFSFLEKIVPIGFSLPDVKKFYRDVHSKLKSTESLAKSKNRGEQQMMEFNCFLEQPFFKLNSEIPSVSGPCPPRDISQLRIETLECENGVLKKELEELGLLLTSERAKSNDLLLKVQELEEVLYRFWVEKC